MSFFDFDIASICGSCIDQMVSFSNRLHKGAVWSDKLGIDLAK